MGRIRIIEPKVVCRIAKVMVPVRKPLMLIQSNNNEWEEFFIKKREAAKDYSLKKEFDTCRAVIKWAETCGGKINYCENAKDSYKQPVIEFEITFSDRDSYNRFDENFDICVRGSVM